MKTLPPPAPGWSDWEPWGTNARITNRRRRVAGMIIAHGNEFQCRVMERPAAVWQEVYRAHFRRLDEAVAAAEAMMAEAES